MVERSRIQDKTIVIADRGYESYNVLEHIAQKGWNYVIRVKDIHSGSISSSLILPDHETFDVDYSLLMTRRQTNEIKAHKKIYKFVTSNQTFDFLPRKSKDTYPMNFRILRFPISDDTYEVIITMQSV